MHYKTSQIISTAIAQSNVHNFQLFRKHRKKTRCRLGNQSGFEIIRPINNLFDRQSDVLKRHNTDV